MWVRSQDKEILTKVREFIIYGRENGSYIIINETRDTLGEYSTKEKALKVLDMIVKVINGKSQTRYDINGKLYIEYYSTTEKGCFPLTARQ